MPYFTIRQADRELGWRELNSPVTVGRHRECDVCLVDSRLSRTHCRFEPEGNDWAVVDLGSRNGTWCDGVSVDRVLLIEGDTLYVGRCALTYYSGKPPETGRYQAKVSSRPCDPHEALQGTVVGVTVVERPRDPWIAMSARIRPRPMPREVDLEPRASGTGLLDLDLEPETRPLANLPRTRFLPRPIKLELPTLEGPLSPDEPQATIAMAQSPTLPQSGETSPSETPLCHRTQREKRRISLDFWLFCLLATLLATGAVTIYRWLPRLG